MVHNVFHVSMLQNFISDPSHIITYDGLEIEENLCFEEKPVKILDRKEKELRNKIVPLVRVLWRSRFVEEETWEREDEMKKRYPELF